MDESLEAENVQTGMRPRKNAAAKQRRSTNYYGASMSEGGVIYTATDGTKTSAPEPGMVRQVLAYSPELMLVRHNLEKGWKGARHSHPHHQLVYVVRGHIQFQAAEKSWEMRTGDSIVVDGGIAHEASALEESEILDVFTPYREEYA
jgi:quercetin dioxygenase-like cupin family protein